MNPKEKIIKIVNQQNYLKGLNYNFDYIEFIKIIHLTDKSKIFKFHIKSERNNNIYNIDITTKNNEVILTFCSCPQFEKEQKCKHIAACLIKENEKIFPNCEKKTQNIFDISNKILNSIQSKNITKEQLNLEIELDFINNYYNSGLFVKLKIGKNKLYSVSSKAKRFFDLYNDENNNELHFGKDLTYDSKKHYFNDEDSKIIEFLSNEFYRFNNSYYSTEIYIQNNKQLAFFKLLKNKKYTIEKYGTFSGYQEKFPFNTEIKKDDENYIFKINIENNFKLLSKQIMLLNNEIYILSNKYINIIDEFSKYNIYELNLDKKQLGLFADNILPIVKNEIKIDDNIKNDICIIDPLTKIYFDVKNDKITCNIKFKYNDIEIDYFDNTTIIRNKEFEKNIIEDLLTYNFKINNNKLEIAELNDIANFIEQDLIELSNKYEVYTTKKLDSINIIKNNKIESQFSIGQDNIMRFDFKLDNININELNNIFNTLKEKKKYYKLKNGNILNLEQNNELIELQNLMEDMDINYNNLKNNNTIPKYRAIFLDSLKETKYNNIKTNNLFNEFVNKFKKYKDTNPHINDKDKNILRDYQLIGVKWLYNIYKCDLGGILADEMGLGKSLQTICFIKSILHEKPNIRILIVSPTSLIYNWQKEFDKFANELNYYVIAENKNKRQEILNHLESNIVITTYGLLRQDKELYEQLNFEIMIIDEAQNIKNPNAGISKTVKEIKAKTKIALTGTPIENSVIELWSIFDYIMPGFLTNLTKFQNKYNIKEFNEEKKNILNNLNKQISPFILRRKKIDVTKELPEKIENNIYFDMYPEQKKIYIAQLKKTKDEMDEIIATEGFRKARFKILQLLTKLRQICIDPKIIFENYDGNSIKIDELITITKKIIANNHKILLFTSFKTALEIVKKKFAKENITTYTIDGSISSKKRMELVEKFNTDDTNVFLIMLKAGGTGLNLTSADVVIHLDLWWNPQVENQATDRAHRIGQKNNVEVIKLICKGTIEDRIIELQNKKKILSDALIEGDNRDENLISKLSEKEIKSLLTFDEK